MGKLVLAALVCLAGVAAYAVLRSGSSTTRAVTDFSTIISSPTVIGSLKRRGPALPGLT